MYCLKHVIKKRHYIITCINTTPLCCAIHIVQKMVGAVPAAICMLTSACYWATMNSSTSHTGPIHSSVDCVWRTTGGQSFCEGTKGGNAMSVKCVCVRDVIVDDGCVRSAQANVQERGRGMGRETTCFVPYIMSVSMAANRVPGIQLKKVFPINLNCVSVT